MAEDMQWYQQEAYRSRLGAEYSAVRSRFPQFRLGREGSGDLYWQGELTTNFGTRYEVKISYPRDYPSRPPAAYVVQPKLKQAPHTYGDGGPLCLFNPEEGASHGFDPARTTAAAIIAWTAEWLAYYEVYRRTGSWPSGKRQH